MDGTMQTPTEPVAAPLPGPAETAGGAKVRRRPPRERLKAERVEEKLRGVPGWQVAEEGKAIDRVREFPSAQVAALFGAYAMAYGGAMGLPVTVDAFDTCLVVTVHGRHPDGRFSGLSEPVFEVAKRLG